MIYEVLGMDNLQKYFIQGHLMSRLPDDDPSGVEKCRSLFCFVLFLIKKMTV